MTDYDKLNALISQIRDRTEIPQPLTQADMNPNPFAQFAAWLEAALNANPAQPNAMCLTTAAQDGTTSARMVLLKEFDESGFVFFTNYESQKGYDLAQNPQASLLFYWENLRRQVRITGSVEKISQAESEEYFHTRPRESQLGAWASPQSRVIESRDVLEKELQQLREKYPDDTPIPLPPFWGGYLLTPVSFEFWQHHRDRLHDRFFYQKNDQTQWHVERLAP